MLATFPDYSRSGSLPKLAITLIAAFALSCNSPVAPETAQPPPPLLLTNAQVSVEGVVVNGESFQMGHINGSSTFFQATLMGPEGPAAGHTVQAQYQVPHQGPGNMMGGPGQGLMTLYDDGTHGDPVAGDGIYCYEDHQGQHGFHMRGAPAGRYHYEFFGIDQHKQHTNRMSVDVTMTVGTAAASSLRITNALVMVDGELANGQTIEMGHMTGTSTFFQAHLMDGAGPALGHTVQVQYQVPHNGPGQMMGGPGQGYMYLYDDGTHGDPIAGDGIYCYEDVRGQYGFHRHGAPAGRYHYEFFGIDHDHHHTNHIGVTVTMVSQ